jgi:hypothetical protein
MPIQYIHEIIRTIGLNPHQGYILNTQNNTYKKYVLSR